MTTSSISSAEFASTRNCPPAASLRSRTHKGAPPRRAFFVSALLLGVFSAAPSLAQETPLPEAGPMASRGRDEGSQLPARRILVHSAAQAGLSRYAEGALGVASAGALVGIGFAAEAPDMTWSHALWVSSGVIGAASLLHLLVPSDLERLAGDSANQGEDVLRAQWRQIAEQAKLERRVGAVIGALFGTAAVVVGVVVLEGDAGDLSSDNRRILGTSLVAGGALSLANAGVDWFVPSVAERDFALVHDAPGAQVSFSAAPTLGGVAASLTGVF